MSHAVHGDTTEARPYRRDRAEVQRYPTDLTDEEWARIAPLLPKPAERGRKRQVDVREALNAIRYIRQANEILRKASACFAQAEFDRPFRR